MTTAGGGAIPLPVLVAIGAWLPQSGFTRVLASVLSRLASRYDIHYIGMSYKGPPLHEDGIPLHPCNLRGGDVFGAYQGRELDASGAPRLCCCSTTSGC